MVKNKTYTSQNVKKQVQNNAIVLIVIGAALVFSFSAVWIKKSFDDLVDYRQMLSHERAVLDQLEQNQQNIASLQEQAADLEKQGLDIDAAVAALPLRLHPSSDMANLEFLVSVSGLKIEELTVGSESESGEVSQQSFEGVSPYVGNLTVTGSYAGLKLFLSNVEASKQPLLPMRLQVNSDGGVITTTLEMSLYHQGDSEGVPGEEDFEEPPGEEI